MFPVGFLYPNSTIQYLYYRIRSDNMIFEHEYLLVIISCKTNFGGSETMICSSLRVHVRSVCKSRLIDDDGKSSSSNIHLWFLALIFGYNNINLVHKKLIGHGFLGHLDGLENSNMLSLNCWIVWIFVLAFPNTKTLWCINSNT